MRCPWPGRGAEIARAMFRLVGPPRLLGETACALRAFFLGINRSLKTQPTLALLRGLADL
jgi:hypothetical protein